MLERLQKIISAAGVTSRRAAEELIAEGRVRVNGKVVTELGTKADPSRDHIKVDGKLINPRQPPTYIMLNKPAGFVTTMSDPEGRPMVHDLLKGVKVRVYPVGRLDYNTEGLLLLTNDGDFAHLITHPRHEFPKTYLAKVKGVLTDNQIGMLEKGMFLQDGKTAPARVKKVRKEEANSWVEFTIHEGRKRQVRRMFDHIGSSVIRLKRTKTGSLVLGDLPEGSFRHLTNEEVSALRETALKTDETGRQVKVYKQPVKKIDEARTAAIRPESMGEGQEAPGGRRARPGRPVMQDTRTGLRKNQGIRAVQKARPAIIPGAEAGREGFARRESRGESAARSAPGKPSSERPGRKPAFRSSEGVVRRESGSEGPARSSRKAAPARDRQKPVFGSQGAGRTEGSRWKPSGPRPNKSKFTGNRGQGAASRPGKGARGPGSRGPRR
jgi:23S rRNA pseudouridine2605 synthase